MIFRMILWNLVAISVLSKHLFIYVLIIYSEPEQEVAPDSSIYNTVIHGLCLRGKIRLARKVYTKMRSIGLKPDGKTRSFMLQHIAAD